MALRSVLGGPTVIDRLRRRAPGGARSIDDHTSPFRHAVVHDRPLALVNVIGLAVVVAGLAILAPSANAGFDFPGALGAILSQLGGTLWPAIAVSLAVTLQVAAGASLVRIMRWSPYRNVSEAMVAGAVGAIAMDTVFLIFLGPLGLFHILPLALLLVAATAVGLAVRPFFLPGVAHAPRIDWPAWLLVGLVWSAPVLLQLASPLAPFVDVLPNHVAPVEHLRVYGTWETLAVSPSPIYGPSRIFLGYIATLGTTASLAGLDAGLAIAAFALPLTILFAAAGRLVAGTLASRHVSRGPGSAHEGWEPVDDPDSTSAAFWVLLTLPLTFAFLRLPDARATVLAFLPAALSLVLILDGTRWVGRSRPVMLSIALGAGVLVHPAIGAFTFGSVGLLGLVSGRRLRPAIAGIVGGLVLASPQLAVMAGLAISPLAAVPAVFLGPSLAALLGGRAGRDDWSFPRPAGSAIGARAVVIAVGAAMLLIIGTATVIAVRPSSSEGVIREVVAAILDWSLLLVLLIPLVLFVRARIIWLTLGATLVVGLVAALGAEALGHLAGADDLLVRTISYELPKSAGYWIPWILAIAGALGLSALWRLRDLPAIVRVGAVGGFVVLAGLSLRPELLEPEAIEQHRYAETLAISLRNAQDGYWVGHPDERRILDEPRRALVRAIREQQAAGAIRAGTPVLHVSPSFQQWEATPLGVFTGVMETSVSEDPEDSIHTAGGRLYGIEELSSLLGPAYPWLVVEDYPDRPILEQARAVGYLEVWRDERAVLLRR